MKVKVINVGGLDKLKGYNRKLRENGFKVGSCLVWVGREASFQVEVDTFEDIDRIDEIMQWCRFGVTSNSKGIWEMFVID